MSKTLQQIIGGRNLTGLIQGVRPGIPKDVLPATLFSGASRKQVKGNTASYYRVNGTRKTARLAAYGGPSQARTLEGVSEQPVVLLHTFEHVNHAMTTLTNIESTDGNVQKLGQQEVDRQTAEFGDVFDNLRAASVMSAFGKGAVHFDGDGNLLPTSSGASVTVDFAIPAGNKDQLDVFGTGAIIGASWATAGTKIITDLMEIHQAAIRKTGYRLRHAIYGKNILDYLLTNTQAKELINRNQNFQSAAAGGMIPQGFGDLTWWPGYQSMFFEDQNGTFQSVIGDDDIVFFPEPDSTWYELLEGTFPVPQNINITPSGGASVGNFSEVAGRFSYATIETDPPSIKHMAGDTFLPAIKVPGAVFIADTTP